MLLRGGRPRPGPFEAEGFPSVTGVALVAGFLGTVGVDWGRAAGFGGGLRDSYRGLGTSPMTAPPPGVDGVA